MYSNDPPAQKCTFLGMETPLAAVLGEKLLGIRAGYMLHVQWSGYGVKITNECLLVSVKNNICIKILGDL